MLYGADKYKYELVQGWAKLPEGSVFLDISSISIDSEDRVYILNRSARPIMVFDREGNLLTWWGEGLFERAHGSCIGPDNSIYCTDVGHHTIYKFNTEGKLLQVLGTKGQPSETGYDLHIMDPYERVASIKRSGPPFNRPTSVAVSPSGEIYVSDGYGNARIHKFTPEGTLMLSWGSPGIAEGEFRVPHSVWVDKQERVWVVDRLNDRIQIFDNQGKYLNQWTGLSYPTDIYITDEETVFISEIGRRVNIFTIDGKLLARWGMSLAITEGDKRTALFFAPHAIAVDSRGDIYVGDVSMAEFGIDRGSGAVQKFARVTSQ